jgi:hypothetical protein
MRPSKGAWESEPNYDETVEGCAWDDSGFGKTAIVRADVVRGLI